MDLPQRLGPPLRAGARGAAEVGVALASATLVVWSASGIDVDPLDRIGQVSGLAALQLRFLLGAFTLLALLLLSLRLRGAAAFPWAVRLTCAGVAGLLGGMMAGGVMLALRGTPYGLGANGGDVGVLQEWADGLLAGVPMPDSYPPLPVRALAVWAKVTDQSTVYATRDLQIFGAAVMPPLAYLAWRSMLPPLWALVVGVTAALPLLHPYKPYEQLVLIALVPTFALLVQSLRRTTSLSTADAVWRGGAYGVAFGALFLSYSGWFLWSAPGAVVVLVVLCLRPSGGRKQTLLLTGCAGLVFLVLTRHHLISLVSSARTVKDSYFSFDVYSEPTYIALWRDGLPGAALVGWPPVGELGGVGLYTVILAIGLGAAVTLGKGHPAVIGTCALAAGAWLLRFVLAARMYETQSVQLYPRTAAQVLHCLLLLGGFAIYLFVQRRPREELHHSGTLGTVGALVFLFGSAGSATANHFLPSDEGGAGLLAFYAQTALTMEGKCSAYTEPGQAGEIKRGLPAGWRRCKPVTPTPAGFDPRRSFSH